MPIKAAKPQSWFHTWRSTSRPAPDTDAADHGTAFGLDMSLKDLGESCPVPTAAAPRRLGWVQRLTDRRRSVP